MNDNIPGLSFTVEELESSIEERLINKRKHPSQSIFILNYSPMVQYNREWNDVTKSCRGLILDEDYNIVARPFQKIFNYTEIVPDPVIFDRVPQVSDKADGSLGIIYQDSAGYKVATRGSFESDQAIWATKWLNEVYPRAYHHNWSFRQPEGITTLVEIIYPENRICVDYGQRAELVLLAAIDNQTGADIPLQTVDWWEGARIDEHYGLENIDDAYRFATSNEYNSKEGVVCTWFKYNEPSFRLKIKHPEYVRLHGIIHNFSKKKVWETLAEGGDFLELLEEVPDEFYTMVKSVVSELKREFSIIENYMLAEYNTVKHITNKKDFAAAVKSSKYSALLFAVNNGKDYKPMIWKMIKPKGE
jgi:RNA ligase